MTIKPFYKVFAALLMSVTMVGAGASSVSFDQASYGGSAGDQISVTINYDFSDFAMFGGGMDLAYDTGALSFVSYTQAPLQDDAQAGPSSPVGALIAPGLYAGFGIGTFEFFNGMISAGPVGTFLFDLIGSSTRGDAGCGAALCLSPNLINPFVSLNDGLVNDIFFPAGSIGADVMIGAPIPVPAAIWFMLSGVGALMGLRRRS